MNISVTQNVALTQAQATQNNLHLVTLNNCFPMQNLGGVNTEIPFCYGNLSDANNYFDNRLRNQPWKRARNEDKLSALREATTMIDRLNFRGSKADPDQTFQFPRAPDPFPTQIVINNLGIPVQLLVLQDPTDIVVPQSIIYATYEVAMKLIQGYDPDREADLLSSSAQSYSGVRTTYDRSFIPDYMRAGIPSFRAWSYIKPFLRDPGYCYLTRV